MNFIIVMAHIAAVSRFDLCQYLHHVVWLELSTCWVYGVVVDIAGATVVGIRIENDGISASSLLRFQDR